MVLLHADLKLNKAVYTASGAPKLADKRRRYGPTDGRTDRRTDGRTDPLIEVLRSTQKELKLEARRNDDSGKQFELLANNDQDMAFFSTNL